MVNKKGYMKTVEAVLAAIIFFGVVLILVGNYTAEEEKAVPDDIRTIQDSILNIVESDSGLRMAIIHENPVTVNNALNELIPPTLNYEFTICPAGEGEECTLPEELEGVEETVYVSSVVISSTYQTNQNTLFRLFLYRKI